MNGPTLYGLKSCDKVRAARAWLKAHGVAHQFHDVRADGLDRATLEALARRAGWEALLNRASVTFRALPDADKAGLTEAKAVALLLRDPTMMKRPVLDAGGDLLVGFDAERYAAALPNLRRTG